MPDQENGYQPSGDTNTQPLTKSPVTPVTPEEKQMREEADIKPQEELNVTAQFERDVKWGEIGMLILTALMLVTNIVIAKIYFGQLKEMQHATKIAGDASKTATDALNANNDSFTKTFAQMQAQTRQAQLLAEEAKRSADAAKQQAVAQQSQLALSMQQFNMEHVGALRIVMSLWQFGLQESTAVVRFQTPYDQPVKWKAIYASMEFRPSRPRDPYPLERPPTSLDKCGTLDLATCIQTNVYGKIPPSTYSDYLHFRKKLYVWGFITYSDERGSAQRVGFCQYVSAKDVTEASYPTPDHVFRDGFHICP